MVDRDDLPDGGAGHVVRTIGEILRGRREGRGEGGDQQKEDLVMKPGNSTEHEITPHEGDSEKVLESGVVSGG